MHNANTAGPNTNRRFELTAIAPRMRAICSASPRKSCTSRFGPSWRARKIQLPDLRSCSTILRVPGLVVRS